MAFSATPKSRMDEDGELHESSLLTARSPLSPAGKFEISSQTPASMHSGVDNTTADIISKYPAKIFQPLREERICEVYTTRFKEEVIEVPEVRYIEKVIEVPQPIYKVKVKYVRDVVIKEKIKPIYKPVIEEKIIEVPQIQYLEKFVEVPRYIQKKEKIIEKPRKIVIEHVVPVLRTKKKEYTVEIPSIDVRESDYIKQHYRQ